MTRDELRAALLEVARRVAYAAFDGGSLVVVEPIVDDYLATHPILPEPMPCIAAEREACAALCDDRASCEGIAEKCAAAIRARSGSADG